MGSWESTGCAAPFPVRKRTVHAVNAACRAPPLAARDLLGRERSIGPSPPARPYVRALTSQSRPPRSLTWLDR
jgi:hypothetical protein